MVKACPICGAEEGVTHGDQLWVREVCEDCQFNDDLMTWWEEHNAARITKTA